MSYSLSRKFKALQVNLFELFNSKINMLGGLVQAPAQVQLHYIFIVTIFKNPFLVASTAVHGIISRTHGNQGVIQTHLLHELDSFIFQKIQTKQIKKGFACCNSKLYYLKYITWTWGVRIYLMNSQDTLQKHEHHFQAQMAEKRLKCKLSDF